MWLDSLNIRKCYLCLLLPSSSSSSHAYAEQKRRRTSDNRAPVVSFFQKISHLVQPSQRNKVLIPSNLLIHHQNRVQSELLFNETSSVHSQTNFSSFRFVLWPSSPPFHTLHFIPCRVLDSSGWLRLRNARMSEHIKSSAFLPSFFPSKSQCLHESPLVCRLRRFGVKKENEDEEWDEREGSVLALFWGLDVSSTL